MVDQAREREDKYEVGPGWTLPDLSDLLPPGGRFELAELALDNTYWDTPSGRLSDARLTLRRRIGGHDAGWTLKVPDGLARTEISNRSEQSDVPAELAALVSGVTAGEELKPVAKLAVARTVHRFVTEEGAPLVEVAVDVVDAATLGSESTLSSWREVEVELLADGGEKLLTKVGKRLRKAGAEPAAYASKLRRALGDRPAPVGPKPGTVGALVSAYVAEQVAEVVRCDLAVRLGEPEIHKFRVALRRLRSTFRVFAPVLDADRVARLEPELVWLAGLLGEVRDRDILRARLAEQVAALPAELVLGPVAADIETALAVERKDRLAELTTAMASPRYQALVADIISWRTPPLTARAAKREDRALAYVGRAEKAVVKRLARANGDVELLHRARKAAKRYRYAAELVEPTGDKAAARAVEATRSLQTELGEHQDSVVSAEFLRRFGAANGAGEGRNGFTYGLLLAAEWQRAERIRRRAGRRWGRKH